MCLQCKSIIVRASEIDEDTMNVAEDICEDAFVAEGICEDTMNAHEMISCDFETFISKSFMSIQYEYYIVLILY